MRIKDMRQGLHTLVQTQGLDGLQHLFNRLAPRGRVLLFCLLCAEADSHSQEQAHLKVGTFEQQPSDYQGCPPSLCT